MLLEYSHEIRFYCICQDGRIFLLNFRNTLRTPPQWLKRQFKQPGTGAWDIPSETAGA